MTMATYYSWKQKQDAKKKQMRDALTITWSKVTPAYGRQLVSDCGKFRIERHCVCERLGKSYRLIQIATGQRLATCCKWLDIRFMAEKFKANPNRRTDRGTRREV